MKKIYLILIIFALVVGFASNAYAAEDGNSLLSDCLLAIKALDVDGESLSEADKFEATFCMGMFGGIVNINVLEQQMHNDKLLFCIPENASALQTIRVFVKYLEDHPEELHESGSFLIALAFKKAFPCKSAEKK